MYLLNWSDRKLYIEIHVLLDINHFNKFNPQTEGVFIILDIAAQCNENHSDWRESVWTDT